MHDANKLKTRIVHAGIIDSEEKVRQALEDELEAISGNANAATLAMEEVRRSGGEDFLPCTFSIIRQKLSLVDELSVFTATLKLQEGLQELLCWFVRFIAKRLAYRDTTGSLKADVRTMYHATLTGKQFDLRKLAAWPSAPFSKSTFGRKQELLNDLLAAVDAPEAPRAKFNAFFKEIYDMIPKEEPPQGSSPVKPRDAGSTRVAQVKTAAAH